MKSPDSLALLEDLQKIDTAPAGDFARTLDKVAQTRLELFQKGVGKYRSHPFRRPQSAAVEIPLAGSARLLDFANTSASGHVPLLIIPSMINRYYVLDLLPERSFVRAMTLKGYHPYVLDWGEPGDADKDVALDSLIMERALPALQLVAARHGQPVPLVGYCMGGLLALAMAQLAPEQVNALVLLATPWDFHAAQAPQRRFIKTVRPALESAMDACGHLPVDVIQTLFASLDPFAIHRKFRKFAGLRANTSRARQFVALEDWLNDGVPLSPAVARECLFDWYLDNAPAKGTWTCGTTLIDPGQITQPSLAIIPSSDRIVPPASATALARHLPACETRMVKAGHISMVTGRHAAQQLYGPVARWLDKQPFARR